MSEIEAKEPDKVQEKSTEKKPLNLPATSTTEHVLTAAGKTLKYTATTGLMEIKNEQEKILATIFYVAYTANESAAEKRPITFAFNGGPGSSSVWLHMGALGPKRVVFSNEGDPMPPPYSMTDNEYSWLEFTDLVFIDPVSTGFSRPAPEEKKEQFHGVSEDLKSVGEFIRLYTAKNKRWISPKFLAGESYGTTRAAGLSAYLQTRFGMYLNGMFLISAVLDFQTIRFKPGLDLPYILHLPSYTAAAHYHKKLSPELQENLENTIEKSRTFAANEYMSALWKGDKIPENEKKEIAKKLSYFTGLSEQFILNSDLRINIFHFSKELLRDQDRSVGRLDARYKGIDRHSSGESFDYDPSYDAVILGPYSAMLNHYLRENLKFEYDIPYEILTGNVHPWNWGSAGEGFTNVAESLREAMSKNPYMKIFVANGYHDLATPFYATEYTTDHLQLDPILRDNITMKYYHAGHMMYVHGPSLQKLSADAKEFAKSALPHQ